jgi:hypothetical protein
MPLMDDFIGESLHATKNESFFKTQIMLINGLHLVNLLYQYQKNSFGKKVMLSVWWNSEGMVHFEMIPNGRSITAALYCQQLDRVQESLRLNYPAETR